MSFMDRVKGLFASEGEPRGPWYGEGELGHWFHMGKGDDGFQRNLELPTYALEKVPAISGAKNLYRNAFAQLRPEHMRYGSNGDVSKVTNSAAFRILARPNSYETGSDFNARFIDEVITHGECVALATRDNRAEVTSLNILPRASWQIYIEPESKELFYFVSETAELMTPDRADMAVPARDVLHFRCACHRNNPLIGVSPLVAAGASAGVHTALTASQLAFFSQMRRPSGVLSTDHKLSADQSVSLREAWDKQASGMNQGGVPILSAGLTWHPMSVTSADAEVINSMKLSNDEIFRAMGVPPPLLGALEHATLSNVEQMVSAWLSFSLGGLIERYERALDRLFNLDSNDNRIEMDVTILLRSDLSARMDAYSKMVNSGVATPNEIRRKEGLARVDGGDSIFLQRQMTPVDLITQLNVAELEEARREPAPVVAPPEPELSPIDEDISRMIAIDAIKKAMQ